MSLFYKLTTDTAAGLIESDLAPSSWKLWTWVTTLDPFADRQVQITWEKARQAIKISRATFYRSLRQLVDSDLLTSQKISGFCVSLKNETTFSGMGIKSQNCDIQSQNCDSSLYIDLQTDQTLSEGENTKKTGKIPELDSKTVSQDSLVLAEIIQTAPANPISQGEEKFSAARTKKSTKSFDWFPDGPWNIEGKLDPNFRDYIANDWLKRFGGDIHAKRADVLAHFKKDPANLPIRWEQYQSEFLNRVQNTQILLSQGVAIKPETQDKLLTHHRALTAELPAEMNVVASIAETSPTIANLTEAVTPIAAEVTEVAALPETPSESSITSPKPLVKSSSLPETPSKNPEAVETEDGQRLKVFKRPEVEEDDRDPGKLRAMVMGFVKGFGQSRSTPVKPQPVIENLELAINREATAKKRAYLDELNAWIADPLLRDEAVKKVSKSESYKCLFDEFGNPYQVIECEEF
jgi:hypothetical protein